MTLEKPYGNVKGVIEEKYNKFFVSITASRFHTQRCLKQEFNLASLMKPANDQANRRIRIVSPEPSIFAHVLYKHREIHRRRVGALNSLSGCIEAFMWSSIAETLKGCFAWRDHHMIIVTSNSFFKRLQHGKMKQFYHRDKCTYQQY